MRHFGNRTVAIRFFGQDPLACQEDIRFRTRRLELDRAVASGYGDRELGVAPEFRLGKRGDGPLMRQFGHTCALRSPLSFTAGGFEGDYRLGGEVSGAPGSFLCGPGWPEHERLGGNSAPERRRRRALRVSRFEFRDGLKAARRSARSVSRRSGGETVLAGPCSLVEEAPGRQSGIFRSSFTTRLARPVRPTRRDALDGVFATAAHRTVESVPPCAPIGDRRGFPFPLSFAGIRADEERVPCRKFR